MNDNVFLTPIELEVFVLAVFNAVSAFVGEAKRQEAGCGSLVLAEKLNVALDIPYSPAHTAEATESFRMISTSVIEAFGRVVKGLLVPTPAASCTDNVTHEEDFVVADIVFDQQVHRLKSFEFKRYIT